MKLFIKILLFVFVALVTNVKVVIATITFPYIQATATSFSFQNEIPKMVFKVFENDLSNCCQNRADLVAYRNWGASVEASAAKTSTASWGKVFNYRHGGQMSAIEHIMYRHSYNTGFSNVSRFAQGTNARMIKGYVDQAVKHGTPIKGGFEYNFGRVIGTGANGAPASSIRVYVRDGWVRTAFPF